MRPSVITLSLLLISLSVITYDDSANSLDTNTPYDVTQSPTSDIAASDDANNNEEQIDQNEQPENDNDFDGSLPMIQRVNKQILKMRM